MPTEFNDAAHYGLFKGAGSLRKGNTFEVRQSELMLAAMRSAGLLDNMIDGTVPPATTSLWLDKNTDPAVLKEWDSLATAWQPMSFERMFERAAVSPLVVTGGTGNAIVVSAPVVLIPNRLYSITPSATNTAATTIQVTGVGTYSVTYLDGDEVNANEFVLDQPKVLLFRQGRFEVLFATSGIYAAQAAAEAAAAIAQSFANSQATYNARGIAAIADIPEGVTSIRLNGDASEGDGLGGLFIDTDSGSTDTFTSADGRTWYRVKDVGVSRVADDLIRRLRSSVGTTNIFCDPDILVKRYDLLSDRDTGAMNVIQNYVFDEVNRYIYATHVTGSGPEYVVVNRYRMDGPVQQASIDYQKASTDLRHQSLAIEYLAAAAGVKLWSSSEVERTYLTRFTYNPGGAPSSLQKFKVWEGSTLVVNPHITKDQKYLIAQSGGDYRVFDFQAMIAGGEGDYTGQQLWSFTLYGGNQGYDVMDGKLYTIDGTSSLDPPGPNMRVYDIMTGEQLLLVENVKTGAADALTVGDGNYNEPEVLRFYRQNPTDAYTLSLGFAQGNSGAYPARINRIYTMPSAPVLRIVPDEADATIAALTNASSRYKRAVGNAIRQFVERGIWSRLGMLYILAATTEENAYFDWKNPFTNRLVLPAATSYTAVKPTFVAKTGLKGVSNACLRSTLTVDQTIFSDTTNHMSVFCVENDNSDGTTEMCLTAEGASGGGWLLRARSTSSKINHRNGRSDTYSPAGDVPSALEDITACRDSDTLVNMYFRGQNYYAGPVVAQPVAFTHVGTYMHLFGRPSATPETSLRTIAAASIGGTLSRVRAADKRNILRELLDESKRSFPCAFSG